MKKVVFIVCSMVLLALPFEMYSQEGIDIDVEKSAAVFLEEFSDDFQENFFEALKQKGIENYDKAVHLFLKCKQLDANNRVVDHELAKAYSEDKKFILAEDYAIVALLSDAENPWYLETLVTILEKQEKSIEAVADKIPYENPKLKENLALTYFKRKKYDKALNIIDELKKSSFSEDLTTKINQAVVKRKAKATATSLAVSKASSEAADPLKRYRFLIKDYISKANHDKLLTVSEEALEAYPSQPYFYYAQGYALNRNSKPKDAIEILEAGLDFLINDAALVNKFNSELASAYTATGNTVKANMYLSKLKP